MKKIIMFGASEGSLLIRDSLIREYEVIAICDNNIEIQGDDFYGIPIIGPQSLLKYEYDFIVISNRHGTEITRQLVQEYSVIKERIIDYFKNDIFDNRIGVLNLLAKIILSKNLSGDVAELGVYQGDFASYINEVFQNKEFYLFDTFEGFSQRDCELDTSKNYSQAEKDKFSDTNVELVMSKMRFPERLHIKKGWFPDTVSDLEDMKYCLVSLDADLYKPIYDGLKYFYPRLVEGGYIIIHDYNSVTYKGTKEATDLFCKENNIAIVPIIDNCGSAIMAK